jgi:hypothetical protein
MIHADADLDIGERKTIRVSLVVEEYLFLHVRNAYLFL